MADGILIIDKPDGCSSAYFARKIGRLFEQRRVGHGGTLDPLASGVLVLLLGQATVFARFLLSAEKHYLARAVFGVHSPTLDAEGPLTNTAPPPADLSAALSAVIPRFRGDIMQTPPLASAIKHKGKRLYRYARQGVSDIDIPPRPVHIASCELTEVDGVRASFSMRVSGGTYIRSLVRDMARAIDCDAYLSSLRRTAALPFCIDDATSADEIEKLPPPQRPQLLMPIDSVLQHIDALELSAHELWRLGQGQRLAAPPDARETMRVYDEDKRFGGLVECRDGVLFPLYLLHWTREPLSHT